MNNNYINNDLIKNFDITDQLIQNNPNNQDTIIMNYINLIINNSKFNNSYIYGNAGGGGGRGNNINVYNNYNNNTERLITDTTVKNNDKKESFHNYYSI